MKNKSEQPKTQPKVRLKSKRLILESLSDEELAALIDAEEQEELKIAYGEMLSESRRHPDKRNWYTAWSMKLRETGEAIGDLGFKGPPDFGIAEIGYGIHPEYEGKGLTTEAAKVLIDWAFSNGAVRVEAETDKDNKASMRVLEKLGFVPDGTGEEGPRFSLDAPMPSYLALYMCLGTGIGSSFGILFDSYICFPIGIAVGVLLGALADRKIKKYRSRLLKEADEITKEG